MKKTYLDALMSIFTPIPLNNGFYFVDNNGTIDWILSNISLIPQHYYKYNFLST